MFDHIVKQKNLLRSKIGISSFSNTEKEKAVLCNSLNVGFSLIFNINSFIN